MSESFSQPQTMEGENDRVLLSEVQSGDETALTRLFQRHSRLVFSVAMRVLQEREDAEDVLQEVFMQIWKKPPVIDDTHQSAGPLLAVMARNRAIDHVRKRKQTQSVDDLPLPSSVNLEASSEQRLLLHRVREVVKEMPPEQQTALDLAFFQGLTHTEIAASTGTPLGTVKTRIRAAINLLERTLRA